jgi:preprotein translocase subunit SecE
VAKKRVASRQQQNRLQRYYRETIGELRKVTWPTRKEAINLTIIVLVVIVVLSAILGSLDFLFREIILALLGA